MKNNSGIKISGVPLLPAVGDKCSNLRSVFSLQSTLRAICTPHKLLP